MYVNLCEILLCTRTAKSGKASVNKKMDFCQVGQINFCCVLCFFEVQNVFGCQKLDLKTLLTSMRQCWSSERSKHRHRELRLWQACALHNDWTSRDDTDFYSDSIECDCFSKSNCTFVCDVMLNGINMYLLITFQKHFVWYMHIFLFLNLYSKAFSL